MIKPIPDFPDYFADEEGNIYSTKRTKFFKKLRQHLDNCEYAYVGLRKDGKKFNKKVHQLVLITFVSPRPIGMVSCHGINGKSNNSVQNLYWATQKQNSNDRERDGTQLLGINNPKAKLNELQVRIIRRSYSPYNRNGVSSFYLAKIFSVTSGHIINIIHNRIWKHL